ISPTRRNAARIKIPITIFLPDTLAGPAGAASGSRACFLLLLSSDMRSIFIPRRSAPTGARPAPAFDGHYLAIHHDIHRAVKLKVDLARGPARGKRMGNV